MISLPSPYFLIGLASSKKVRANELAECVNLTEIMDFMRKSETFLMEHHLERKFNISLNSMRSEGERDLVFTVNFGFQNLMCKVKLFLTG